MDSEVVNFNTCRVKHYFERADVVFDRAADAFRINVRRFGMNGTAYAHSPYICRLVASRMVAAFIGESTEPYDAILHKLPEERPILKMPDELPQVQSDLDDD